MISPQRAQRAQRKTKEIPIQFLLSFSALFAPSAVKSPQQGFPMRTFTIVLMALVLAGPAAAQTSFPMITHTNPVAVQRGKTTEITVEGQQNFHGTYKALFEGS